MAMTEAQPAHFTRHRFPAEIIAHAVWLYYRFPLSFRDVEDLLAERGIDVSFQTVSEWAGKFGPKFADSSDGAPAANLRINGRDYHVSYLVKATPPFEVMRALGKGQAAIFNLTGDIRGEARIVERAFRIGPSALTEAVALLAQSLENREAAR